MAITKRIVCLANSRKLHGRCIAGREIVGGLPAEWIRPVSDRQNEEVSEYERQYADGGDPRVLDIIDVPLREPLPRDYQQENWLLDPNEDWVKVGQMPGSDLGRFTDQAGELWINGSSTYNGVNDYIPLDRTTAIRSSLRLVHVDKLDLKVFKPGEPFGNPKRRVQGQFQVSGSLYALWVTDPGVERAYLARDDGIYPLGKSYLTISLGEPHDNRCYKLIAAVIDATDASHV